MGRKKIHFKIAILILIQSTFLFIPQTSNGQWDSDRPRRPSPGVALGIRTGYDWNKETWSLGGQVKIPLSMGRGGLEVIPSGDIFFIEDGIDWQFNLDAALRIMMFYGGAGLAYLNRDFQKPNEKSEKTGINYFVGMPLPIPIFPAMLFVEARWTHVDDERLFRFIFGVNFSLGGNRR